MKVLAICPGKDGDMKDLIIKGQGKTSYLLGFQAEVRAQAHGWAAFCFRCKGCLLESGDLAFKGFGFLFRVIPVDGIQGIAFKELFENL